MIPENLRKKTKNNLFKKIQYACIKILQFKIYLKLIKIVAVKIISILYKMQMLIFCQRPSHDAATYFMK